MFDYIKNLFKKNNVVSQQKKNNYKYEKLYQKIGYYPASDELLYHKALTHSSYNKKVYKKNERLEFLGDVFINFAVAEILYKKFEEKDEGLLTQLRANIVSRKYLNEIGLKLELHQYLKHKLQNNFHVISPDIVGNTFEALMGAYYVDRGIDVAKNIIQKLLIQNIDFDSLALQLKNKKSYLHEWSQVEKKQLVFKHLSGNDNSQTFVVEVHVDEHFVAKGSGRNKKEAELDASTNACAILGI